MKKERKEQFEKTLKMISGNESLIEKLVIYLENNNLMDDLFKKIYYTIEREEPIYKVRYYKDAEGKLLSMCDVKNYNISVNTLEKYSVYVYDEIKTLFFAGYEINKRTTRNQENSKSYDNLTIKILPLHLCADLEKFDLVSFIKLNPLLFVYVVAIYNIDLNKMDKIDRKSFTYKKEIKNN